MPVFISHKKEDSSPATQIRNYLTNKGIKCYLDVLDPATQTAEDITDLVLSRLNFCTHLMAVLSQKSKDSWWIPFEVGAASNAHHRVSSYKVEIVQEPEFLSKWPIMTNFSHLDKYSLLYQGEIFIVNETLRKSSVDGVLKKEGAKNFHDTLKRYVKFGY